MKLNFKPCISFSIVSANLHARPPKYNYPTHTAVMKEIDNTWNSNLPVLIDFTVEIIKGFCHGTVLISNFSKNGCVVIFEMKSVMEITDTFRWGRQQNKPMSIGTDDEKKCK